MKVLFVDDRPDEVGRQWSRSGCGSEHELLPMEPFASIERTCQIVATFQPDTILVGFGLGIPGVTGADVIRALRERGYAGAIIANSGGGKESFVYAGVEIDGTADRKPMLLTKALKPITTEKRK